MVPLTERRCRPCDGGVAPLSFVDAAALKNQLSESWLLVDSGRLEKEYKFKNFRRALDFTNRIGEIAEQEGHHPDIYLAWGKVRLILWTHAADGLTENDFIFAAKSDMAFDAMTRKAAFG
jgi:4a-hydroxytetrahydrobiopterin dehydratase